MALVKVKDFDPDYREAFGGYDIKGLDVYSDLNHEKIGSVYDLLVDEQGHFRYFIVDLGFWGLGRKVMLPVDRAQVDNDRKHLYALGFDREHVQTLPEFNASLRIDDDRRDHLQNRLHQPVGDSRVHSRVDSQVDSRPTQAGTSEVQVLPIEYSAPLEHPIRPQVPPASQPIGQPLPPPRAMQGHSASQSPIPHQSAPPEPSYPSSAASSRSMPAPDRAAYSTREPAIDPMVQRQYSTHSTSGTTPQSPSILQQFEERLRAKRMQSHS